MATAHDVASYILQLQGPMSTWKLQKLVYYSQAWHLAWDDEPLFQEHIEAWANGPVVRSLYKKHRGVFQVRGWEWGSPDNLADNERDTIEVVLDGYGGLSGRQLSLLSHAESPWQEARGDLPPTARSTAPITPEALQLFYSAVDADPDAAAVATLDWGDA